MAGGNPFNGQARAHLRWRRSYSANPLPRFARRHRNGDWILPLSSLHFAFRSFSWVEVSAAVIALVSVTMVDALFVGPPYHVIEAPTDMLGDVGFLIVSAMIIGLVQAIRTAFDDLVGPTVAGGVIFSLEDDQACDANAEFDLRLGPQAEVAEMMTDFVAQVELAKRLNKAAQPSAAQQVSPA